ncbi:YihY/virulence factor BrkB family protein [Flavobacteriaceae bacterium XHP0103]|uniref:YihY/virulence factor BrkB family protein n=1 Tax=Marixanthotalea marina TaxID=2844359 RepID=UPI002989FE09|nr:YihY/virulence factor BrkB family protein [Marixanthotalea marina]MBU3822386.1 YihY/virulence factor BrkB family protein [Marixanthotalea marina]
MSESLKDKLEKIPVLNTLVRFFSQIKLPGLEGLSFYDLLELYITGIVKGALTTRASAIAFSFFMALFPFLLFILIVIPYVPIDDFKIDFLKFLESYLPTSTSDFFYQNIFLNIDQSQQAGLLSSVFVLSVALMANGINALFSGFENSYHSQLTRNVFRQYLYALGIALILAFLFITMIVVLGYFQIYVVQKLLLAINDGQEEKEQLVLWSGVAKSLFSIMMVYLATATLYYFGTKEGKESSFFSVGAVFTTFLVILTSYFFGIYIDNFGQYNKLYGSIGALLILMFYLWLNANVLLLGYELNASLNKLRKRRE